MPFNSPSVDSQPLDLGSCAMGAVLRYMSLADGLYSTPAYLEYDWGGLGKSQNTTWLRACKHSKMILTVAPCDNDQRIQPPARNMYRCWELFQRNGKCPDTRPYQDLATWKGGEGFIAMLDLARNKPQLTAKET